MFKKLSRSDALEDISNWSTNDVLCLLRKNGLEECCKAITKRQVDGDELLPDDNGYYLNPTQKSTNIETPPPLPAKPPQPSTTPSPTLNRTDLDKLKEDGMCSCFYLRLSKQLVEGLGARLADEVSDMIVRIKRGLSRCCYSQPPEPPESTYGNHQDGHFLLRPSTTNVNNPLALVLWYKDRVYNVPVRKRPDNRYALGSAKVNEKSFSNVEEIVMFYTREELVLHSGGVEMGSTKLTDTPPK
ncbi:B-cell linker protein [Melipona quadrifasciata]|uniref:B-cell linker protein n=1 Tax=Melipona quadrifasciata TaxID=166423 RepID=A0A0N0BF88_9HYME|nr:B-cell linker protein [Melipona quadrifasciata]